LSWTGIGGEVEDSWGEISASCVGSTSELDDIGVVAGAGSSVEIVSVTRCRNAAIFPRQRSCRFWFEARPPGVREYFRLACRCAASRRSAAHSQQHAPTDAHDPQNTPVRTHDTARIDLPRARLLEGGAGRARRWVKIQPWYTMIATAYSSYITG